MARVKKIDISGVRRDQGDLQTAMRTYQRASDGKVVTLLGTLHMAEAAFYRAQREEVDKLVALGAEVHYEGSLDTPEGAYLTDDEAAAVTRLRAVIDTLYSDAFRTFELDWERQTKGAMAPAATWHNIDINDLDTVRLLGPGDVQLDRTAAAIRSMMAIYSDTSKSHALRQFALARFIASYVGAMCSTTFERRLKAVVLALTNTVRRLLLKRPIRDKPDEVAKSVIWTYREYLAILAALKTPKPVVMIWHGHHLPGLGNALLRNGFTLTDTQWHTAICPPAVKLRKGKQK